MMNKILSKQNFLQEKEVKIFCEQNKLLDKNNLLKTFDLFDFSKNHFLLSVFCSEIIDINSKRFCKKIITEIYLN